MISYGLSGVFGTLLFISPNYNVFISLRFVNGMAIGGFMISRYTVFSFHCFETNTIINLLILNVCSFVIIIEIVGRKWRDLFAVIYHLPFNMAHATIPFLAYYVNNWKYYCLAQSIPILCLLPYYFIGPESPRWLYTHGELEKSIKILVKAAKINGKPYEEVTTTVETCAAQHSEEHGRGNFLDLFKTPNIRKKTMVTCFCWFSCGITFFGIAQYITFLGNDPFTPEAISASLAFPASMILYFLCKFWGRKKTLMLAFLVQLIPMIILIFLNENSVAPQICVCVALFGTMIAFPVLYLYTGELMPTVIRNAGVGIGSTVSVMGSMISPHIPGLKTISSYVPPLLFTIFPSIAFFTVVMLPETRNRKLPETIDDAESFGKNVS